MPLQQGKDKDILDEADRLSMEIKSASGIALSKSDLEEEDVIQVNGAMSVHTVAHMIIYFRRRIKIMANEYA